MRNLTLKARILSLLGSSLVLLAVACGTAVWILIRLGTHTETSLSRMKDAIASHDVVINALEAYRNQADSIINGADATEFAQTTGKLRTAMAAYAAMADTPEEKIWATEMQQAADAFVANYQQEVLPRAKRLAGTTDPAERTALQEQLKAADGNADALLAKLTNRAEKGIASLESEANAAAGTYRQTAARMKVFFISFAAVACAVGAVAGYIVANGISRKVATVSRSVAAGSEQTVAAAGQISSTSQSLASGASEQAASLEETSASLEELSSMTKRNADNATRAKELSTQTRAAADAGANDMEQMKMAMDAIKCSSTEIGKIVKSIDEIAFQTNILALNAAVEAARAGEAGMGFAVVAEEVRALAQRSAQSARDTAQKIEESVSRSESGVQISGQVATSLKNIVDKARQVDALVAEIASASVEQTQGIGQVSTAVTQIDKVTQSNAGNAEETAAAAEELNAQAIAMQEATAELRRLVDGVEVPSAGRAAKAKQPAAKMAFAATRDVPSRQHEKTPPAKPFRQQAPLTVSQSSGANGNHDAFFRNS